MVVLSGRGESHLSGGHESVVWVMPDTMGGAMNIVANLLEYRQPDGFTHHAILTHNQLAPATRFGRRLAADTQTTVEYRLPVENLHAVIRRLHRAVPPGDGVLVANDLLELAMVSAIDLGRTVMMILHADTDYYYDLAERHVDVVDVFICYGARMAERLRQRLPARAADVRHLPYGIPLPARTRTPAPGPLRLLYAGRLDQAQKGVFDLPEIDAILRRADVPVSWTVVGGGPDEAELRERWPSPGVRWLGTRTNREVLEIAADHDVLVLPTRAEGYPVMVVEAMAVGLACVVSRLESGIAELVDDGVHGLTPPVGDVAAFAAAIRALHLDRDRLEAIGAAARQRVAERHDIRTAVAAYQALLAGHHALRRPRPASVRLPYGSRLDRPWIPNPVVRAIRTAVRRHQGKPV